MCFKLDFHDHIIIVGVEITPGCYAKRMCYGAFKKKQYVIRRGRLQITFNKISESKSCNLLASVIYVVCIGEYKLN